MKITRPLYATTTLSGVPYKAGEPWSITNPLPVTLAPVAFKHGEVVSPTNPLPITLNPVGYKYGEAIDIDNPAPIGSGYPELLDAGYGLDLSGGGEPSIPNNVLTLSSVVLTLGGEPLTLGAI